MNPRHQLMKSIPEKWHGLLPMSFQPRWSDVWNKQRPQKEAGFLWSVLHCAVAVNTWRAQMAPGIPISCLRCPDGLEETIIHRFHHCTRTRLAWQYGLTVLYTYLEIPTLNGTWPALTWQQCLLGSPLPRHLQPGRQLWSLFRGSIIWLSWLDRNAICFHNDDWPQHVLETKLWVHFTDHGRTAWLRSRRMQKLQPTRAVKHLRQFDRFWMRTPLFGTRTHLSVQWKSNRPPRGLFH
jgi:hypothetical protein